MGTHRNTPDELAKLLVQCRADRKLTLEAVARAVGLTARGLSNIERGVSKPRRSNRLRLADFLRRHGYFPRSEAA